MSMAKKTKSGKKNGAYVAGTVQTVTPSNIVPIEIRRLMNSHRNNPRMNQAVAEFINESNRPLDSESLPLLSKSGFTSCQIPKMALQMNL